MPHDLFFFGIFLVGFAESLFNFVELGVFFFALLILLHCVD